MVGLQIYFQGVDVSSIDGASRDQVNLVLEAYLDLPDNAVLASRQDVETIIENEKQKDVLGCDEVRCMAEIAGALGARFVISGNVAKLGGEYLLSLRVVDSDLVKTVGKVVVEFAPGDCLTGAAREAAQALVR